MDFSNTMLCWLRPLGAELESVRSVKVPLVGSHSQISARSKSVVERPPKMRNTLRAESKTMPAPERAIGPPVAGVRSVHVLVAGFHSHRSWNASGYWSFVLLPDSPPNMTSTLRVSSKAADCR